MYRTGVRTFAVRAHVGMRWFRSNIRLGSRLSLSALAIQFLLAFGHFHGVDARAAPALLEATPSVLQRSVAATQASACGPLRLKGGADHEPDGQPTHDCAICAVMALAGMMAVATPPCLLAPQAAAFTYLAPERFFSA
jgi:hypothetical protein